MDRLMTPEDCRTNIIRPALQAIARFSAAYYNNGSQHAMA
jgi:hypothetical protein